MIEKAFEPLTVEIDLDALAKNYHALQQLAGGRSVIPVVKADGYGCGAIPVTRRLIREGANHFYVAGFAEALILRREFPEIIIYVFEGARPESYALFGEYALRPTINSLPELDEYADFCAKNPEASPAALHFDTGMNRLGLSEAEADLFIARGENALAPAKIALILTHAACADTPDHPLNQAQKQKFTQIRNAFPGIPASYSASAAILFDPEIPSLMAAQDAIRPGIALYGGVSHAAIRSVVTVRAPILQIREAKAGESVGYGATATLARNSRLAIVAYGYADGCPRSLSGSDFHAVICGCRAPLIGRVSMDMTVFDVTDIPATREDRAELIGEEASLFAMAELSGTIPYEILTGLSRRAKRIYHGV